MIELRILSGSRKGETFRTDRGSISIGRSPKVDFSLVEPGVWDLHAEISQGPDHRFRLKALGEGTVTLGSVAVREATLKQGVPIQLGTLTLEFWLSPSRQSGLRFQEIALWLLITLMVGLQGILVLLLRRA